MLLWLTLLPYFGLQEIRLRLGEPAWRRLLAVTPPAAPVAGE
jgi:hypothetical protein